MSFGTCCVLQSNDFYKMKIRSVAINGVQHGMILNLEVIQTFKNNQSAPQKISYIFPNDLKLCIYETIFIVGDEIIKPKLATREEAKKIYDEAVEKQKTAIYGSNIAKGLTEFKIGNLLPQQECKVVLKIAFQGNITSKNSFFFKFPLDIYTPSGSIGCLNISNHFTFNVKIDDTISQVSSNVKNGIFDSKDKTFKILKRIENNFYEKSIILNFETIEPIKSSIMIEPKKEGNQYETCALTIVPDVKEKDIDLSKNEFVFVVDCSGSMEGDSIKNASECLEYFIRSKPNNSYFNIVLFGSRFSMLERSVKCNSLTASKAINVAQKLKANLGGTNLIDPLNKIFSIKPKYQKRNIFLITDGETDEKESILEMVTMNKNENVIYSIGIGRGCDAGLLENMASITGGSCDFIQEGDSISNKIIPMLQSSLNKFIENPEIHIEGDDKNSFEISPFPLQAIKTKKPFMLYLRAPNKNAKSYFSNGILFTGSLDKNVVEFPICDIIHLGCYPENEIGCSKGYNYEKVFHSLFAFNLLHENEIQPSLSTNEINKAIKLSLSSGVLCKYTGYIGMIEPSKDAIEKYARKMMYRYMCFCVPPPREFLISLIHILMMMTILMNQFLMNNQFHQ